MYSIHYSSRRKIYTPDVGLCQLNGLTCIGCCINLYEKKEILQEFMKINTETFNSFFPDLNMVTPTFLKDYISELEHINRRDEAFLNYNCYFAGFLDENCENVGCLIHPFRLDNIELRDLIDVNCVPYEKCYRDILWEQLPPLYKNDFLNKIKNGDWFDYSRNIFSFIPSLYINSRLSTEKPNSYFYNIAVKDQGIPASSKIKKNLDLISEFYSKKSYLNDGKLEKNLLKYGELYLEKVLEDTAVKNNLVLNKLNIPSGIVRDGDEYINGERNYLLFGNAFIDTDDTVMLITHYDNPEEKLGNNMKNTGTISFMIDSVSEIMKMNRNVNYLWVFLGGEKDTIIPLTGSAHLMNSLLSGINIGEKYIKAQNILAALHLHELPKNKNYSVFKYHIPPPRKFLTEIEQYLKDRLYKNLKTSIEIFLDSKEIEGYFIDNLKPDCLPGAIDKDILIHEIREYLKDEIPLTLEKIDHVVKKIFNDIFGFSDKEKKHLEEEVSKIIIKHVYNHIKSNTEIPIDIKLASKGIIAKLPHKISRFIVSTHPEYTAKLTQLLQEKDFVVETKKYAEQMSFYYFAFRGIPSVSISGSGSKNGETEPGEFMDAFLQYLRYLEGQKEEKRNFIKMLDV